MTTIKPRSRQSLLTDEPLDHADAALRVLALPLGTESGGPRVTKSRRGHQAVMPHAVRVTLTLSGGASLGAYQAGATAALLVALEHLRDEHDVDVRVDAVGGASAGSIVALIAAYSLLEGVSGCDVLHQAWVERVSIDTLLRRGSRGPLSLEGVRAELPDLLRGAKRGPAQEHPLALHVALTGLRGLTYEVAGLRRDEPVSAVTFADWKDFVLEPGGGPAQYFEPHLRSPLDAVLASASHPGAFAPRVLDRREDRDAYERQGVANLPRSGWLWYTDGGLVQTEPVGRTLSAARRIDGPGRRPSAEPADRPALGGAHGRRAVERPRLRRDLGERAHARARRASRAGALRGSAPAAARQPADRVARRSRAGARRARGRAGGGRAAPPDRADRRRARRDARRAARPTAPATTRRPASCCAARSSGSAGSRARARWTST